MLTGLPPKVESVFPATESAISAVATVAATGTPFPIAFA